MSDKNVNCNITQLHKIHHAPNSHVVLVEVVAVNTESK